MRVLPGYTVTERLYDSLSTSVFRARRDSDGASVIVKTPTADHPEPAHIARYHREYKILHDIGGGGIIAAHALERVGAAPALILEDVVMGVSLARILADYRPDFPQLLRLFVQMADLVGAVHARQVIHKDINPNNFIFNRDSGAMRIIDFGISSRLSREEQVLQSVQLLEGTLAYISPEQTGRMNRPIDYRTDLYSLGATFYEMLTRSVPFEGRDSLELVHAHIAKVAIPPHERDPKIPRVVSSIVMRLLEKSADARYRGAFGLRRDLERCEAEWSEREAISYFDLGERDVSNHFQVPQKLYGCESELQTLLNAFERAAVGESELIWVLGSSGIGKSSLVHEVQRPVTERRGYFIAGKFDQFQRDIPHSAVIVALRDLVRQLMTESEERLADWKAALKEAVGPNGAVVTAVIPEVEWILGGPVRISV